MRLRRGGILAASIVVALCAAWATSKMGSTDAAGGGGPRVLVVSDLGDATADVAAMTALGWDVRSMKTLEVEYEASQYGLITECDAIWVPSGNPDALRFLMRDGGPLDRFASAGGTVVWMDVAASEHQLDVGLGGVDAIPLPAIPIGAVSLSTDDHPIAVGLTIGSVPLIEGDLDPESTGGGCCVVGSPEDDTNVIASNAAGPVLVDYGHGDGRVVACALKNARPVCRTNILRYVASLSN